MKSIIIQVCINRRHSGTLSRSCSKMFMNAMHLAQGGCKRQPAHWAGLIYGTVLNLPPVPAHETLQWLNFFLMDIPLPR